MPACRATFVADAAWGVRCGRTEREGMLTIVRRSVLLRPIACLPPAMGLPLAVGCARSPRTAPRRSSRRTIPTACARAVRRSDRRTLSRDRVCAVGDIGGRVGRAVGGERVIPPHREQRIAVSGVLDSPDDQSCDDGLGGGRESGEDVSATSASEIQPPV